MRLCCPGARLTGRGRCCCRKLVLPRPCSYSQPGRPLSTKLLLAFICPEPFSPCQSCQISPPQNHDDGLKVVYRQSRRRSSGFHSWGVHKHNASEKAIDPAKTTYTHVREEEQGNSQSNDPAYQFFVPAAPFNYRESDRLLSFRCRYHRRNHGHHAPVVDPHPAPGCRQEAALSGVAIEPFQTDFLWTGTI